ncbi:MAG: methionyl-tRNA formyltransferase [Proteobacteria bacterium]|nr:methionyl-tRNA formyltransferase [Pseudomonadota bacterium]HQR03596.1 methionyl-tRNA formyltransferase [Rhodocyclaceae bacterium]
MKVAFAGTPEFAAQALEAILAAGFEVPLVLTQPDRPTGRGQKLQPGPVKRVALSHGIPLHQPEKLKDPATHAPLLACAPEVMVVAAYGLILPQTVLDIPRAGCLNIHASLLPRWRGAAPIQRAIEAGDAQTGISIMAMEAGLDTGPVLLSEAMSITADDSAATLHDKLARQGARLIVDALQQLPRLVSVPQPEQGVTYARKIEKHEARIDWSAEASLIACRIRAFDPFPGATTACRGETIKLWRAVPVAGRGEAGTVLGVGAEGIVVACGQGALRLLELQKPGGRRLSAADFLRGHALAAGDRFD